MLPIWCQVSPPNHIYVTIHYLGEEDFTLPPKPALWTLTTEIYTVRVVDACATV